MRPQISFLTLAGLALAIAGSSSNALAGTAGVAVAAQYDTTHVYVAPDAVDGFVRSFLGTFGGKTTSQVVATVTPTPSSTTSQLLQTPVGTVSLFGFKTPIPYPFGLERNGYMVTDMDAAIKAAREAGASVIVEPFPDPIGRDAVIQWPGGINMQLYWHTKHQDYAAFQFVPENRVYVSPDAADEFVKDFIAFSDGEILSDATVSAAEIGMPGETFRRIRIQSGFGQMQVLVTNGHLPYPYGYDTTGYEVEDLPATLEKAVKLGARLLVPAQTTEDRQTSMVQFPGGYIAEIHQTSHR